MIIPVVAIPTIPPLTRPDEEATLSTPDVVLHVPPPASDNKVVNPEHTVFVPKMAVGKGLTVTVAVI